MGLDVSVLRNSFQLALDRQPHLTRIFYQELFARNPEAQPLFAGTDMAVQEQMLGEALVAVLDHLEDAPWLQSTLAALGAKHAGYGVTPEMYDPVGRALIATLRTAVGDEWTAGDTAAWQEALGAITGMMLAGYPAAPIARPASTA
jgi:hemoglobin-like flavoprotein